MILKSTHTAVYLPLRSKVRVCSHQSRAEPSAPSSLRVLFTESGNSLKPRGSVQKASLKRRFSYCTGYDIVCRHATCSSLQYRHSLLTLGVLQRLCTRLTFICRRGMCDFYCLSAEMCDDKCWIVTTSSYLPIHISGMDRLHNRNGLSLSHLKTMLSIKLPQCWMQMFLIISYNLNIYMTVGHLLHW